MRKLLLLLFMPVVAFAKVVIEDHSGKLELLDEKGSCEVGQEARLEIYPGFNGAGKYKGCYIIHDDMAFIIWEDGDRWVVPLKRS